MKLSRRDFLKATVVMAGSALLSGSGSVFEIFALPSIAHTNKNTITNRYAIPEATPTPALDAE
jgi:anaerobic selenocysteine-containing dehydrogenase